MEPSSQGTDHCSHTVDNCLSNASFPKEIPSPTTTLPLSPVLGKVELYEELPDTHFPHFQLHRVPDIGAQLIATVGIGTGDEGKGRTIVDFARLLYSILRDRTAVAMVFKVNGGSNSGHTAAGLKLNLLPSAVADPSIPKLAIGRGVVADPMKFRWEIRPLEMQGYQVMPRLAIDSRTMVSDFTHRLLDLACEHYRTEQTGVSRGSTGRGISPAFCEETGQTQIFYNIFKGRKADFAALMKERIQRACSTIEHVYELGPVDWYRLFDTISAAEARANAVPIQSGLFPRAEFDFNRYRTKRPFQLDEQRLINDYWEAGRALGNNIVDTGELILEAIRQGRYVLAEFGQAYWLDKRHGFQPNVTASHTYTPEFFQSANIPLQPIHTVGVCKAYDTKVGTHVFTTQMEEGDPLTAKLKSMEFGTSTGRQRMVGWFDAVEKGQTLRRGGFQDLVINKLDALTYEGDWKGDLLICRAYKGKGGQSCEMPLTNAEREKLSPVYSRHPGWTEDISQVRHFGDLPLNAQLYVAAMYRHTVVAAYGDGPYPTALPRLRFIGVGPGPDQVIADAPAPECLMRMAD